MGLRGGWGKRRTCGMQARAGPASETWRGPAQPRHVLRLRPGPFPAHPSPISSSRQQQAGSSGGSSGGSSSRQQRQQVRGPTLRPKDANHSGPRRRMVGDTATVSTLVTANRRTREEGRKGGHSRSARPEHGKRRRRWHGQGISKRLAAAARKGGVPATARRINPASAAAGAQRTAHAARAPVVGQP